MSKQGQGGSTATKQERLAKVLRQRMFMTKSMGGPFHMIDAHAGCGMNYRVGCLGSPLIAIAAAESTGRDCRFYFIEKDRDAAAELTGRIPDRWRDRAQVFAMDNRQALPLVLDAIDHEGAPVALGCLYCDPNGYNDLPRAELARFAGRARLIDLYFSLNATAANRIERCAEKCPGMGQPDMRAIFGEVLALKRYHMVAAPPLVFGFRFMLVLLTNSRAGLSGWKDFIPDTDARAADVLARRQPIHAAQKELF